jgi:spore coat polysaccharide biosynthesis protein SpsF
MDGVVTMKNIVAVIQARMTSSRLPGKVMLDLCGKTVLERVLQRTRGSNVIDDIWFATSCGNQDDVIELVGKRNNVKVYRGNLTNVLDRFCSVVYKSKAEVIIRITADNPFTETRFIDLGVDKLISNRLDYVAFKNIPYGSGIEVIRKEALIYSIQHTQDKEQREHVTMFVKKHPEIFKMGFIDSPIDALKRPDINVTIDTLDEYVRLYKACYSLQNAGKCDLKLEDLIVCLDRM